MDNTVGKVIITFLVVVIGITFLSTIAGSVSSAVNPIQLYNETLMMNDSRILGTGNVNSSVSYQLAKSKWYSIDYVAGSSGNKLTEDSDYVVNDGYWDSHGFNAANETIYFLNSTVTVNTTLDSSAANGNLTYVTYKYKGSDYVDDSTSRTLINLITLFFTIGLMVGIIVYIWGWDSIKGMLDFD